MAHLHLRLLGGFEIQIAGRSGALLSAKKSQALLAYLALYPGQHRSREKLAALLWSETADEFARANLRQTLAVLRKALAHEQCPCVLSAGAELYLDAGQAEIDVVRFEQCCDQATREALEQAVALYQGEFLEGFALGEAAFEDWLACERRRLHERQMQALNTLLGHYLDTAQNEHGIDIAVKLLALDPLQETVHRALMQCYHAEGRRRSVLRQYEDCCETLQRELGVKPEAETEQLYRQLLGQSPTPADEPESMEDNTLSAGPIPSLPRDRDEDAAAAGQLEYQSAAILPAGTPSARGKNVTIPARSAAIAAGVLAVAVIAGITDYRKPWQQDPPDRGPTGLDTQDRFPGLSFDKPSIAVLPITNMSDDPEQEYFSDGLTEDLITDLSKLRDLFVIARHSSFVYKGKAVDVRQVGRELGVRYVLEGGVRKIGEQIRITTQLIDATTGDHLWAQRYDRPLADIPVVQDEIRRNIVAALDVQLSEGEQARLWRRSTSSAKAYDHFLEARELRISMNKEAIYRSIKLLEEAVELDPEFAVAWTWQGWNYTALIDWAETPDEQAKMLEQALNYADRAIELDPSMGDPHALKSDVYSNLGDPDRALEEAREAVELSPNNAKNAAMLAAVLTNVGKSKEALTMIRKALRLNPHPPDWYFFVIGKIYLLDGQSEEAIPLLQKCAARLPDWVNCHYALILAYMEQGREEEAQTETQRLLQINPRFTSTTRLSFVHPDMRAHHKALLIQAGLPE